MSTHVDRYLDHIRGHSREQSEAPLELELVCIHEPDADVERLVAEATSSEEIRKVRRKLDRGLVRGWGVDKEGAEVYDGRRCCAVLAANVSADFMRHPIPSVHQCPECQSKYQLRWSSLMDGLV